MTLLGRVPLPCSDFACRTTVSSTLVGRVPLFPRGTLFPCKGALNVDVISRRAKSQGGWSKHLSPNATVVHRQTHTSWSQTLLSHMSGTNGSLEEKLLNWLVITNEIYVLFVKIYSVRKLDHFCSIQNLENAGHTWRRLTVITVNCMLSWKSTIQSGFKISFKENNLRMRVNLSWFPGSNAWILIG